MPRIAYEPNTMRADAQGIAEQADAICREYAAAGYPLTLRGLYYQFVGRGLTANWPTGHNTERSYKRLGSIVDKARLCGIIDWYHLDDPTRAARAGQSHFDEPGSVITAAAYSYHVDKWQDQTHRVELWVEKEALAGVVARVARARDVDYLACKGYLSSSAMWRSARRIGEQVADGLSVVVLHLGDHDPSGIDMSRDNEERVYRMIANDYGHSAASRLEFRRIALNRDQVDRYNPPPNPAKFTDSRAAGYMAEHGYESWELDALPPDVLDRLMNDHIDEIIDQDSWDARHAEEEADRARLRVAARNWTEIAEHVDTTYGGEG